jgi:chromosome segregation ATPase
MLKKMVILGVIGFVAVSALGGTKIASYIRSELRAAREEVESNIPPEKEIARLRSELKLLDKDTMTVVNQLAKERVEVNQLQDNVKALTEKQGAEKKVLTDRARAIKDAEGHVTFGSLTMTVERAKVELDADVRRYAINQKSLETMEQVLAQRMRTRDTLEKQLDTLKNQKTELAVAIDGMEAELNALKLQQMESKYQTDDTRLSKIKEDLRKLKTKVDVEREKLKLMPTALEAPAAPSAGGKSVDDIMAPLAAPAKPAAKPEGSKTGVKMPPAD